MEIERLHKLLDKQGLLQPILTTRSAKKFEKFLTFYDESIKIAMTRLKIQSNEYKEDIDIFNQEIEKINNELITIELNKNGYKGLEEDSNYEKRLRARQIRATMFGDEKIEKEWDKRVKRFYLHKTEIKNYRYTYKEKNGNIVQRKVNFETIENYKELEEDAYFLNLEYYKKYLEITSIYDDAKKRYGKEEGLELIKSIINFKETDFEEYNKLLKTDKNEADKWLIQYVQEMKEYVKTFHGFTNKHAIKSEVLKTAGSTLKKFKPVRGNLPISKKIGNGAENTLRFFGIRKPEFSKINADGTKVATPGRAALTIATDAGVVIGITTTAMLTGTAGLATWATAYTAKGVVTVANIIKGNIEYKKYKDKIDANLPTLGKASKEDKEVARKTYYREQLKQRKNK